MIYEFRTYTIHPRSLPEFLKTFEAFPPRQKPASFSIDQVLEKMKSNAGSG